MDKTFSHDFYESSRIFPEQEKFFFHDLSELEAKKSQIFSLPIHSNHGKRDLSFLSKSLG
jgi:hypothetical protein